MLLLLYIRGRRSQRHAHPFNFVVGSHRALNPLVASHSPQKSHKTIFGSNGPPHPRGRKVALAVQEGIIRNIANRVTSDGIGAFNVELGLFQAAGQDTVVFW